MQCTREGKRHFHSVVGIPRDSFHVLCNRLRLDDTLIDLHYHAPAINQERGGHSQITMTVEQITEHDVVNAGDLGTGG